MSVLPAACDASGLKIGVVMSLYSPDGPARIPVSRLADFLARLARSKKSCGSSREAQRKNHCGEFFNPEPGKQREQ